MESFRHKSGKVEVRENSLFLESKEKRYRRQDATVFQGWSTWSVAVFLTLTIVPSVYFGFRLNSFDSYHQFTDLDWAQVVYIAVVLLTILILSILVKPEHLDAEKFETDIPFGRIRKVVLTDQKTCTLMTSGWNFLFSGSFSDVHYLLRFADKEFEAFTQWLGSSSLDKKVITGWSPSFELQRGTSSHSLETQFKTGSLKFDGDKLWLSFKKVSERREKWKELSVSNYWRQQGVAVAHGRIALRIVRGVSMLVYSAVILSLVVPGYAQDNFDVPPVAPVLFLLLFGIEAYLQFAKSTGFYVRQSDVVFIYEDQYEWNFGLMLDGGLVVFKAFFTVSEDRDALIEYLHQTSNGEVTIDSSYPTQPSHLASE